VSDPYLIPGTDILRNKFNILDVDELDRRINDVAIAEAAIIGGRSRPTSTKLPPGQAWHCDLWLMKDHFRTILARSEDPQMILRHRGG
jgi:hypothetical protein